MVVLSALAVAGPQRSLGGTVGTVPTLQPHAPIDIESNADFTSANGVLSGTGTPADPYVIAGWSVTAPLAMGLQIRNTDVHAILRNLRVTDAPLVGLYFYNVSNITLANVTAIANTGEGIRFESSRAFSVLASNVTNNLAGVVVLTSMNATIRSNDVTANVNDGIAISGSPGVTVEDNNVSFNGLSGEGYGVDLLSTTDDVVSGNRFVQNGIYLDGVELQAFDSHTITANNTVYGRPVLYEKDCARLSLENMDLGQLLVANCRDVRVANLTVVYGDVGVELAYSSNVTLGPALLVAEASIGIRVFQSEAVRVVNSDILDAGLGLLLESATAVQVTGTKISAPFSLAVPTEGVAIFNSNGVNLTGTIIRHYVSGVDTVSSGNVTLVDNAVGLDASGLVADRSWDLLVVENLFTQDVTGLRFVNVTNASVVRNGFFGASSEGANLTGSSAVQFVHNAFERNADNAYDDHGATNAWDGGYPTGGNFWWNYHGPDQYHGPFQNLSGADGIGDNPYLFNVNATDHYPLMTSPVSSDVPPEALFTTPSSIFVGLPFQVSANLSSDYEDPLGLLRVRWAWDMNASWSLWTSVKYAAHVYTTPGAHTIRLEVLDSMGQTDNWSMEVYAAPKPDMVPPSIVYTPPRTADVGQAIPIEVNVTDPSGVANVTLLYRGQGETAFQAVPMGSENGTNYSATIPAQGRAGTVEYVIVANDSWGNEARAPLSGFNTITIIDPLAVFVLTYVVPGAIIAVAAIVAFLWHRRRVRERRHGGTPPPSGNP